MKKKNSADAVTRWRDAKGIIAGCRSIHVLSNGLKTKHILSNAAELIVDSLSRSKKSALSAGISYPLQSTTVNNAYRSLFETKRASLAPCFDRVQQEHRGLKVKVWGGMHS